jgi:YfiH family protein
LLPYSRDGNMSRKGADGLTYYAVPAWDAHSGVAHGFFTRKGGVSPPPYASLNLGRQGGDRIAHVRENLQRVAGALSILPKKILCASQVHGNRILRVSRGYPSMFGAHDPLQGDGLVTEERGLYLGILTADCVPLLLLDPGRSVVAAVHAGWRGTAKGIAGKAVRKMGDEFGCESSELLVALGPAIGPCCYVVGDEVADAFVEEDPETRPFLHPEGPGRWKLNLEGINRHQLINAGVRQENVALSSLCTCCRKDLFFSVRADGEPTGRQIALIGLRPQENA